MSKHTQGDWLVAGGTTVYCLNAHGYNRFTAQVQRGHTDSKWPTEPEELEANARLIAAAPEILEALKTAHAHIADDALRASIGNIIAKATGGQQ